MLVVKSSSLGFPASYQATWLSKQEYGGEESAPLATAPLFKMRGIFKRTAEGGVFATSAEAVSGSIVSFLAVPYRWQFGECNDQRFRVLSFL